MNVLDLTVIHKENQEERYGFVFLNPHHYALKLEAPNERLILASSEIKFRMLDEIFGWEITLIDLDEWRDPDVDKVSLVAQEEEE